jgi:hypothetical protein
MQKNLKIVVIILLLIIYFFLLTLEKNELILEFFTNISDFLSIKTPIKKTPALLRIFRSLGITAVFTIFVYVFTQNKQLTKYAFYTYMVLYPISFSCIIIREYVIRNVVTVSLAKISSKLILYPVIELFLVAAYLAYQNIEEKEKL